MYKGVGVCFADFNSFFLPISLEKEIIFIGYLKTEGGGGGRKGSSEPSGSATGYTVVPFSECSM